NQLSHIRATQESARSRDQVIAGQLSVISISDRWGHQPLIREPAMELAELIEALSRPEAYPGSADQVEVRHTHISVVFLAGAFAYKVKKPVNLGFLDFSTLEKRRHFSDEEVRLNRRLAPTVYLGVVPIAHTARGIQMEAPGEIADWAV